MTLKTKTKTHLTMKYAITLVLTAFLFISCKETPKKAETSVAEIAKTFPDSITSKLDSLVKTMAVNNKCKFTTIIANKDTKYFSGYDGRTNNVVTDFNALNEIGSCTKMFTATSILQLIEQNKLSLNDPITSIIKDENLEQMLVLDGKNYIDSVKVINLLNHSSGLPDYFGEDIDDIVIERYNDPSLTFTSKELLKQAKAVTANKFIPGSKFTYCNTNYIILGMIIEKISGLTYQEYFKKFIIEPLQLKNTYLKSLNPDITRAQGHFKETPTEMPATIAGSAGEIIASLDDMNTFIRQWYAGKLFKNPETINMLLNDHYMVMSGPIKYGLGVVNLVGLSYGHAGQTFGFQSYMAASPNDYSFAFAIDDANVSAWNEAIIFSSILSQLK